MVCGSINTKNIEAEHKARDIRLRAERKAGELLKDMATNGERMVRANVKSQPETSKLGDLSISKTQSSRRQHLANVPKEEVESYLREPVRKSSSGNHKGEIGSLRSEDKSAWS